MRVPRISHCSCSCNCFWWHVWEVENPQTSVSVLGQMHCKIWANWIGAKRNPIPCIPRYNLLSWCYYLFWKAKVVPKGGKKQSTLFCFYLQAFVVLHSFAQAKSNHMPGIKWPWILVCQFLEVPKIVWRNPTKSDDGEDGGVKGLQPPSHDLRCTSFEACVFHMSVRSSSSHTIVFGWTKMEHITVNPQLSELHLFSTYGTSIRLVEEKIDMYSTLCILLHSILPSLGFSK